MIHLTLFYNGLGLLGSLLILSYCVVQVFDTRINDGFIGRLIYLAIATCCIAATIHMVQGVHMPRTVNTLLAFIGAAMIRRLVLGSAIWLRLRAWWFIKVKEARAHNRSR